MTTNVSRDTLIFFDASCLVAAAGSPSGGSAFILSVCARAFLKGAVSQLVLLEAERNVVEHFGPDFVTRYHRLIAMSPLDVVPTPPASEVQRAEGIVGAKDAHVLAAALLSRAPYLLTLDKGLERRVNVANLTLAAHSPGGFITTILPVHVDYPSIR